MASTHSSSSIDAPSQPSPVIPTQPTNPSNEAILQQLSFLTSHLEAMDATMKAQISSTSIDAKHAPAKGKAQNTTRFLEILAIHLKKKWKMMWTYLGG